MKKIFSFFVAKGLNTTPTNRLLCKVAIFVLVVLFTLPVMAGTIDVLDDSWIVDHHNEWGGSSYNSETKTITFGGGWSGCGWYLAEVSTSDWVSITVEFASAAPHGVLKCEYTNASGGGSNETSSFSGNTSTTLNFDTNKTIEKIYLQLENSGSLTLTSAVVTTSTTTYTVSVTSSNGTVSGTGDFAEDAEVTLTASPNENYSFTGWSSSDITIADAGANPLVFSMPAKAVSVTATFAECTKHMVTLTAGANGSVSGGGEQCDGSVTVTATPNTGYRFVNWTQGGLQVSTDAEYTFPLSADISLTANFEVNPCTNTKTIQCETDRIIPTTGTSAPNNLEIITSSHHYSGYHGDGYCDFKGSDGELYYLFRAPSSTYNFTVYLTNVSDAYMNIYTTNSEDKCDETTITYGGTTYYKKSYHHLDGPTGDNAIGYRTVSSVSLNGTYIIGLYGKSWTVYDQVVIEASSNIFCPNTITMQKNGDASAAAPTAQVNSSNVTTAFEGAVVTVTAGEPSDANHYFSGWTVSPANAVTFANSTNATTTFSMPASDVTITANYGAVVSSKFTYTTSGSGSITCDTPSDSNVNSGTTISMTAVPSDDYVFTGWTATAGTFGDESELTTTFTMPAEAATVTANFAQVDNVIVTGSETTVTGESGEATLTVTSVPDFDAFNHNVLKFAYSNMDGKHKGQKVAIDAGYSSASSAGATGFGFYYKTEKEDDHVAFCFDTRSGQVKWQLAATNNVWKYVYIPRSEANSWSNDGIIIYMNGDDTGNYSTWNELGTHTTYKDAGAFYMSEIAATSITSKPDIDTYHYTYDRGGNMAVNDYGTLCLPMAGTIEGATLYSVAGKEESDNTYLVLEDQGINVVAGKPYITQSTATSYTVTMSGAHSAVQDGNGLVGTYELNPLTPYDDTHHNYILYENAFKKAGDNVTVGAYRAYLNWDAVGAVTPAPSARRIRMVIEGQEVETGMETVTAMPKTTKVLIDGQLYIIREGKRYTLTGARAQ